MPRKPIAKTDTNTHQKTPTSVSTDQESAVSVAKKTKGATIYAKKTAWTCNACGTNVTTLVRVYTAPQHICKKQRNQYLPLIPKGES